MNYFAYYGEKRAHQIIIIIKAISILSAVIGIFSNLHNDMIHFKGYMIPIFFIILLYLVCMICRYAVFKTDFRNIVKLRDGFEIVCFIIMDIIVVMYTGGYSSNFKLLFILAILTTTMQYGLKPGIIVSIIASLSILLIDVLPLSIDTPNVYFQSDLILFVLFFVTSLLIGHYKQILNDGQECNRILMKFLPDIIFMFDDKGSIFFANQAAMKFFHIPEDYDLGSSYGVGINNINPNYRSFIEDQIKKIKNCNQLPILYEMQMQNLDGINSYFEIYTNDFPYKNDNMHLTVIRDITERKKIREIQEADSLKTEFFADISHELRTPLNVMFGSIQVLEMYTPKPDISTDINKVSKYIKIIKQNCLRLLRLANNLIDITKIDAGFLQLNLKKCNIVNVVEEITLSVVSYAQQKGLKLTFDTEMEEKEITCDIDKIERVIMNLLSNAIKFTEPGGNIFVNMYDKGKTVAISIKDTGIGIPKDKLGIIFDRFRRVNEGNSKQQEGSGIGLSIVKSLVEMHDGIISVNSEYGKGSEFIIELPTAQLSGNGHVGPADVINSKRPAKNML